MSGPGSTGFYLLALGLLVLGWNCGSTQALAPINWSAREQGLRDRFWLHMPFLRQFQSVFAVSNPPTLQAMMANCMSGRVITEGPKALAHCGSIDLRVLLDPLPALGAGKYAPDYTKLLDHCQKGICTIDYVGYVDDSLALTDQIETDLNATPMSAAIGRLDRACRKFTVNVLNGYKAMHNPTRAHALNSLITQHRNVALHDLSSSAPLPKPASTTYNLNTDAGVFSALFDTILHFECMDRISTEGCKQHIASKG